MKKLILIALTAIFTFADTGCKKYVSQDDNDPNNPTDVTMPTLLPTIEVTIFATYTGQMSRNAGMWTQHFSGCLFQEVEQGRYSVSENDVQNDWNTLYTNGVRNANILIQKAGATSPYYAGIGKVCKALLLGLSTDYWGDIPSSQAGLGIANLTPGYDAQQVVISDIQALLSDAIANLSVSASANALLPGADDLINSGDAAKWTKTAWILKARYANRISKRDPSGSATNALSYINSANLTDNSDDANANFSSSGGTATNPWFAFEQDRGGYIRLCQTLVDTMVALNDPRLPFYAAPDASAGFSGAPIDGNGADTTSYVSDYYAGADSPLPLVTYVEAMFIKAEAALRSGDAATAQTAYLAALSSSLNRYSGVDTTMVNAYIVANGTLVGTPTQMQQRIMFQKWISNFLQPEAWADWRRTDMPSLTPNPSGVQGTIPRRYPTEQNERLYNPNAVVVSNLTSHVWWDQ